MLLEEPVPSSLTALLAQWLTFDLLYPMPRVWVTSKVHQGYAQVVVRRTPTSNPQHQDRPPFSEHPSGLLLHLYWEEDKILCLSFLCHTGFRQRAPGTYPSSVLRKFCQELLGLNKTPSAGCSGGLRAGAETFRCGAPMPAPSVSMRTGLCQLPASLLSKVQRELTKDRGFQVALESSRPLSRQFFLWLLAVVFCPC